MSRARLATCLILTLGLLWIAAPAHAVVPGLAGPLQAISQLLPQILPFLAGAIMMLFSVRVWRARLGALAKPKVYLSVVAVLLGIAVFIIWNNSRSTSNAFAMAAPGSVTGAWTSFRGNLWRTGSVDAKPGPTAANLAWHFQDPDVGRADYSSSPAVAGGRVYIGAAEASAFTQTGSLYALDAATGKRVWRFKTAKQVFSSPSVHGGKVFVGEGLHHDANCKLYVVDANTGKPLWNFPTKSHVESSPVVDGNVVYFGAGEDGIYAVDLTTRKAVWHRGGLHIDISPAVVNGRVYTGTGYGKLRAMCLDAKTGAPGWEYPADLPVWGPPSIKDGRVFYGLGNGTFGESNENPRGAVVCLDAQKGTLVWRADVGDAVLTAIAVADDRAVFGSRDGNVYCVRIDNGQQIWKRSMGGPVVSSPAVDGQRVYVAGGDGKVHALNLNTGDPAWEFDVRPHTETDVQLLGSPALSGGRLFLGTNKEKVLCIGE